MLRTEGSFPGWLAGWLRSWGDTPCPTSLADGPAPRDSSLSTRRGFAQVCGWVLMKFFREIGLKDLQWSPPTVPSLIPILWRLSSNFSNYYEQVNRANTESLLSMFSLGCGCQNPSSIKIGYGCWNISQLRSLLLEGQAPFRGDQRFDLWRGKQLIRDHPAGQWGWLVASGLQGQIPPLLFWGTVLAEWVL